MIGQDKLTSSLLLSSITQLPHSILLLGESGCGKHTIIKEMSSHYNIDVIDITNDLTFEVLTNIQLRTVNTFYTIFLSDITEKQQNTILKFLEEPTIYSYIILVGDSKQGILDTVYNRCVTYTFSNYSKDILKTFLDNNDENILNVCNTPGQVKSCISNYKEIKSLCDNIIMNLSHANYSNALTITNKINYKDEFDKFDIHVFFRLLLNSLYEDYRDNKNKNSLLLYKLVNKSSCIILDTRINKEILMDNLITNMWKTVRGI